MRLDTTQEFVGFFFFFLLGHFCGLLGAWSNSWKEKRTYSGFEAPNIEGRHRHEMEAIGLILPDCVWIPERRKEFSVFQSLQIGCGPVQHHIQLATGAISSWIKDRSVKLAALLHLVPSLRICGGILHSPYAVMLWCSINPYPTAFPCGNGMVLHFYQQQESSTTKSVHKVINK